MSSLTDLFVKDLLSDFIYSVSRTFLIDEYNLWHIPGEKPPLALESAKCNHLTPTKRPCKNNAFSNGYCSKHQKSAITLDLQQGGTIKTIRGKTPKLKPITMTEQKLIDAMSTAVPQEETELIRTPLGLMDPLTEILFDDQYNVVGVKNGEKVGVLGDYEVEICERNGWHY
jgi:hypothetical protein